MYPNATIAGSWHQLADRLDRQGALERWSQREPALANAGTCEQLREQLRPGADQAQADALLGALVRLGAAAGGDEQDAVLLLLHLLSEGATTLARRLADLTDNMLDLVVGELTAQIRAFPFERRNRAYAASLLRDTRRGVLNELLPQHRRSPGAREVPVTDSNLTYLVDAQDAHDEENDLDLLDLLMWAQQTGVVDAGGVAALLATETARSERQRGYAHAAATACGISSRTSQRRRQQTLTALQAARGSYLAQCA